MTLIGMPIIVDTTWDGFFSELIDGGEVFAGEI